MSTPPENPDEFAQIGSDDEVNEALEPKKTLNLPAATAVLAGIVVLAIGLAGGAGLHAAFAKDSTPVAQTGAGRGAGGYGGFRGQGQGTGQPGQGGAGAGGNAAIGTVVSASDTQLVIKTQSGDVTVKLTGDTAIDLTSKGKATDLKAGEQVVVSGQTSNGSLTATTVRQGGTGFGPGGFGGRNPSPTPSN